MIFRQEENELINQDFPRLKAPYSFTFYNMILLPFFKATFAEKLLLIHN